MKIKYQNHIRPMVLALTLLSLLAGCTKKEKPWTEDLQKKAADTIRGFYSMEECLWEGPAFDMDGDGASSSDFLSEWTRIGSGNTDQIQTTVNNPDFGAGLEVEKFKFRVRLPFQKICWNEMEGMDVMEGGVVEFKAGYTIDRKGRLEVLPGLETDGYSISKYKEFRQGELDMSISQPGYARLQVIIGSYPVFDHVSQEYIKGRLTVTLKRTRYL